MAAPPKSKIEGYVEELTALKLSGWVWEVGSNRDVVVEVLCDGRVIGQIAANRFRKDLLDGGKGNGKHAYEFAYPAPIAAYARPGAIQVRVAGGGDLPWIDLLLRRMQEDAAARPAAPPQPVAAVASAGRVHELAFRDGRLAGRAELPDGRTGLLVAIDDLPFSETILEQTFDADGPAAGPHPFALAVPPALLDGAEHRIAVSDAATGRRVEGGPATVMFPAAPSVAAPSVVTPKPATEAPAPRPRIVIIAATGHEGRAAWLAELCAGEADPAPAVVVLASGGATPGEGLRHIAASQLPALVQEAAALAAEMPAAAVIVSPPGFANLVLGNAMRRLCDCPLLVDADDAAWLRPAPDVAKPEDLLRQHEAGGLTLDDPAWLGLAHALMEEADGVIAGDVASRRAFGGMMVRQGRDDRRFDPARHDRAALRAAAGLTSDDRAILIFEETVIAESVAALERLKDPRLVLCVAEAETGAPTPGSARIVRLGGLVDRPEALAMADCLVAPGRLDAVIEALAMDVPVLAQPAAATADLAASGAVELVADSAALDAALGRLASEPPAVWRRRGARAVYLGEFSHAVNAPRLALALHGVARRPPEAQPRLQALLRLLRRMSGSRLPAIRTGKVTPDLVICTGGNDSDLYGSRADMLAKTLLASGMVRRVVQFDRPISASRLEALAAGSQGDSHRGSLIYASTVRRVLAVADTPDFIRRTFLHRSGKKAERLMGRDLPPAGDYPAFLRQTLTEAGVQPDGVLWVSAGADFAAVRKASGAVAMVADLDESAFVEADEAAWAAAVNEADVVLCGSEGLRERFAALRSDIEVVANAGTGAGSWEEQAALVWHLVEQVR